MPFLKIIFKLRIAKGGSLSIKNSTFPSFFNNGIEALDYEQTTVEQPFIIFFNIKTATQLRNQV